MSSIKKVAVVGASGTVGAPAVKALLESGFDVTAVSREESKAVFPSGVTVKRVDLSSLASLSQAFEAQDAVVSVINPAADQSILIEAAVAAKVKRFIPSEFGLNTDSLKPDSTLAKLLTGKVATRKLLEEMAREHSWFSWTGIAVGFFFDWGLDNGTFGVDWSTNTITVYDSGNEPTSVSDLRVVGEAVAAVLKRPEATANKYINVASFEISQNELLKIIEKETGKKWAIKHAKTADVDKVGLEKLQKGDFSCFVDFLLVYGWADGASHAFKSGEKANSLLGLPEENATVSVKSWLQSKM